MVPSHLFCAATPRATPLPVFKNEKMLLKAMVFIKDFCWEQTRTRSGWLRVSQTIQLVLDDQKLLSSWTFPVLHIFTHAECHFMLSTEAEQGTAQLMLLLCAHNKPSTDGGLLVSFSLCNSTILPKQSLISTTGDTETEEPTSSLHIDGAAWKALMKSLFYWCNQTMGHRHCLQSLSS